MPTPPDRVNQYEEKILAPYAAFSSKSRGRKYPLTEHSLRTPYQRDRDRVVHSAAFRRMEYKTQVFVNDEGDHYRTRLTHTIEVAQISRTIARTLGLNEDLAEAIASVHDLGHTPFGHSGEDVLNELMADFGGFNHNRQSLRVVDILEKRYQEYPGLNLTYEVREGIVKHETTSQPFATDEFPVEEKPTLEASLVDAADMIAYNSHDLDDGLYSGILDWDELAEVPVWKESLLAVRQRFPILEDEVKRHAVVRVIVDRQVTDLIQTTFANIARYRIESLADVRRTPVRLVSFSEAMSEQLKALKGFLMHKMYRHPRMVANAVRARRIIEDLYRGYLNDPGSLIGPSAARIRTEPVEVVVADYIAGMTDRFAVRMHEKIV